MIFALIPAAGESRRMGRPKLTLPLGDRTVLEHVIAALREGGLEDVLVITGPHATEVAALAQKAGASTLVLLQQTPDMRATVEQGMTWLETHLRPTDGDAMLLVPADHPTLAASIVQQLVQGWEQRRDRSIVIPTFRGKRGHPTLVGWEHVNGLRGLPAGLGLNAYFRQRQHQTKEVPIDSSEILRDLDTPEDYEGLRASWGR
jgi:molybdenum cofactor cytidylyltransferase